MCLICGSDKQTRHIDLYIIGSEGLNVCHSCEMLVVQYVRGLISVAGEAEKATVKRIRKGEKENE